MFEASDDESATGPALNPMEGEDKSLGTPVKTLKFFKPCLLKIWCDKYEADDKQAWNPTIMMDSWFLDAIGIVSLDNGGPHDAHRIKL